jgi:hypothetical protein
MKRYFMPDKWEYPWYTAWDLAFHTAPFYSGPGFCQDANLSLMLRSAYLHPGQLPAYEWNFSDVNPPFMRLQLYFCIRQTNPPANPI